MQLLAALVLLPIVLGSAIPGQEKCVWGPPYWCSSVLHARECGATKHCLQTVWKNQIIKPKSTATCTYCELITNAFRDALENKATQAQVAAVLANVCAILGDSDIRDMCQEIVTEYAPELEQMFLNDISTDMICATLDLCSGLEDRWSPYGIKAGNSTDCSDCMKFIKDVQDSVTSNETLNQLLQLLNQTVCSALGTFSDTCMDLARQYLPVALQTLADQIDPDIVCRVFGFCTSDGVQGDVIKIKNIFSERTSKDALKYRSYEECNICQEFVKEVNTAMEDPSVQCNHIVDGYAPQFIKLLANKLQMDPVITCKVVGLCPSGNVKVDMVQTMKSLFTVRKAAVGLKSSDEECDICKEVVNQIDEVAKDKTNQDKFKYELENYVCPKLGTLMDTCKQLVEEYAPALFELIVNEFDPTTLCEEVGLCAVPSLPEVTEVKQVEPAGMVGSGYEEKSMECTICTIIMQEVDNLLRQNVTVVTVEDLLDKVCKRLPTGELDKHCEDFVAKYGKRVIDLLAKENVCGEIGICPKSTVSVHRKQKVGDGKCQLCILALTTVEELIANISKEEILSELRAVCQMLPGNFSTTCLTYLDQYGPMVIDLLRTNPKTLCGIAGMCAGSHIPYLTKPIPENLPAVTAPSKECEVCDTVVIILKTLLKNNATKEEIKQALETVCSYLPSEVKDVCKIFVEDYGDKIIDLIDSDLDANEICTEVGLCKALKKQTTALSAIMSPYDTLPLGKLSESKKVSKSSEKCELCDEGIKMLKSFISENATKEEIKKEVESFCEKVPVALKSQCDSFIEEYGDKIIDLLVQKVDPHQICVDIGLCDKGLSISEIMSPYDSLPIGQQVSEKKGSVRVGNVVECEACKYIMTYLDKILQNNRTEENIKAALKELCSKLPDQSLTAQCTQLVTKYAQTVIDFLLLAESPDTICKALTLCPAGIKELPQPVHIKLLKDTTETLKSTVAGPTCVVCEFILQQLDNILKENRSEAAITSALDKVCSFLPDTISNECEEFVKQYSQVVINLLVNEVDPEKICTLIKLCSTQNVSPLATVVKVLPEKAKETLKSTAAGPTCVVCEFILKELDDILKTNRSEAAITSALDKVCSFLPDTISNECEEFVKQYSQVVINLLVNEVDPEKICTLIKLCSTQNVSPLATVIKVLPEKAKDEVKSSAECVLCEFVMKELESILKENSTKEEIKAALEKVCSVLPSTISEECNAFVKQYADVVIQLITSGLTPAQICTAIQLCSSTQQSQWGAIVQILPDKIQGQVKGGEKCVLCELVMKELKSLLKDNSTETEIKAALEKVCSYLPTTVKDQCDAFVQEYATFVVQLIAKDITPEQVCTAIGLCSSRQPSKWNTLVKILSMKGKVKLDLCGPCKLVMEQLQEFLKQNRTTKEVEEFLKRVCDFLPDTVTVQCHEVVDEYIPAILDLIGENVKPEQICQQLGLCNATVTHKKDDNTLFYKPHRLGMNKCTYGPAYWCANKDNAAECNAMDHCMRHVWN